MNLRPSLESQRGPMVQGVGVTIGTEFEFFTRPVSMTMLAFLTSSWWNPIADFAEKPRSAKPATGTVAPL